MKVLIDIPEEIKAVIDNNGTNEFVAEMLWQAVKNGTPIPDNATVCDIKAMQAEKTMLAIDKDIIAKENKRLNNVIEQIRAEIEQLHYHPKLDFIKSDEVVEMVLDIIGKYMKGEQGC